VFVRGPDHPRSEPRLLVTPHRQRALPLRRWRDQDCPIIRRAIGRANKGMGAGVRSAGQSSFDNQKLSTRRELPRL